MAALLAACAVGLAVPGAVLAQGGSALFAVGEAPRPAKPAARPKAAPAPGIAASPAGDRKATAPAAAVIRRKTRGRTVARKSASPLALTGRWHDSQCIPLTGTSHMPPLYVKRQYEFSDSRKSWQLDAAVYSSDACVANTRLLTYHGEGSFAVTGKSRVASNAYDATFKIDRWSATPATREGVLTLLNARCGSGDFEEGRSLDLSATGCPSLGIRPVARSSREVELVSVSNGRFFLGTRAFVPGRLSDDRPAQLSSYGLDRTPDPTR